MSDAAYRTALYVSDSRDTCTLDGGANTVVNAGHGLVDGRYVRFTTTGALPTELVADSRYYVVNAATDNFQVALTVGGAAVTFTGAGTATHTYHAVLADLTNIGGPSLTAETVDVSSHSSADAYREFEAGILNGGDVTLEGNLTSLAVANILLDLKNSRAEEAMEIVLPTAVPVTWAFGGIVTAYSNSAPFDGKLGFTAAIKVTGKPELT